MADLVPVTSSMEGVDGTLVAATEAGDLCPNEKRVLLVVANGSAGVCTVTVHCQRASCGFPEDHDKVSEVPAGETWHIGPFNKALYNDALGHLEITYDTVSDITVGAIEVAD